MSEVRASITGVGKALPEKIVTNAEIGRRLGVDPEWIESRTGIKQRRFAAPDDSASSLGTEAARMALATAGVDPGDIDAVIVGTCTPDYVFPPTATIIQDALGIGSGTAFDVNAACSGFIYALQSGSALVGSGMAKRILLVGVDLLSRHLNLDDPGTAPLFGDGAGAVVLEAKESAEPIRFEMGSDGAGGNHVIVPGSGSRLMDRGASSPDEHPGCIRMSGREVFRRAVKTMTGQGERLGGNGFDLLIAHQANRRILEECAGQLGIEMDRVFMNIDQYGNTSSGSVPIALCEAWEQGRLKPKDRVLMLAFGAGYTWGGTLLRWTLPAPDGSTALRALPPEAASADSSLSTASATA